MKTFIDYSCFKLIKSWVENKNFKTKIIFVKAQINSIHSSAMKLFLTVLKLYQTIGIYLPNSKKKCSLNWRNVFFIYTSTQSFVPILAFVIFRPSKNVYECGFTIYVLITGLVCLFYYLIQMWQITDALRVIETYEAFIEKSESN